MHKTSLVIILGAVTLIASAVVLATWGTNSTESVVQSQDEQVATTTTDVRCPTQETFVKDFTEFSIALLDANPGYAEKEQRYYWQKHLEEMGCIESQSIIDNAICADCNEDGSWN